ncbi:hypothetical protein AB0E63_13545 [Kribbella sp. NPDC026596]
MTGKHSLKHWLPGPTQVFVTCQVQGDPVTAEGTTNNWWSKLRDQGG